MATCKECGKKISFLTTSNVVDGNLICGECDSKRRVESKLEHQKQVETKGSALESRK